MAEQTKDRDKSKEENKEGSQYRDKSAEETIDKLSSDPEQGLSSKEVRRDPVRGIRRPGDADRMGKGAPGMGGCPGLDDYP